MKRINRNDPSFKISKARADLIQVHPFIGSLSLRLQVKESPQVDLMATDGVTLYYNPDNVRALPQQQLTGAVAHDVMHCALGHLFRLKGRDKERWERACDYAVNSLLLKDRFSLPEGRLHDPKYADMSAEAIYDKLITQPPPPCSGGGSGGNSPNSSGWNIGAIVDPNQGDPNGETPPPSSAELQEREKNWELAVKEAAHVAKQAGRLPAYMERFIEELFEPKVSWRQQLWRFLNRRRPERVTWNKPNRRLIYTGMYLPSKRHVPTGVIVVGVDTSGSISQNDLAVFCAEINEIHRSIQPQETVVVYCDTQVNRVERFGTYDEIKMSARGGGGTSFEPVFRWVEQEDLHPDALVYMTDGYADWPNPNVADYPVLWAITNNEVSPPWGEHLTYAL